MRGLKLVTLLSNMARFLERVGAERGRSGSPLDGGDSPILEEGAPYFRGEIEASLDDVQANLQSVRDSYEGEEAPEGAEAIRDCMIETLDLFSAAVDDIRAFLGGGPVELLRQAVERAEEADDILGYIEYQIEQNKLWMSEYTAG